MTTEREILFEVRSLLGQGRGRNPGPPGYGNQPLEQAIMTTPAIIQARRKRPPISSPKLAAPDGRSHRNHRDGGRMSPTTINVIEAAWRSRCKVQRFGTRETELAAQAEFFTGAMVALTFTHGAGAHTMPPRWVSSIMSGDLIRTLMPLTEAA